MLMNGFNFWSYMITGLFGVFLLGLLPSVVQAEEGSGIEDGDIKQHDLFEFEAFIKHDDVVDGTEPFDDNNTPGNDSESHNKIVRSWDTVTYPLKITINPKKADMLENIKLKISGSLENGVMGNRVNARFAVGGTEHIKNKEVSFEQDYTIERTGNSIMIPITIEVQGAKNGVTLTPDLTVEVVSVDGENIDRTDATTHFNDLPGVTTSAKVSIKPVMGSGLAGNGIDYYPYAGITGNDDDMENVHSFALSWGITKLPGKTSIRGATFPDPNGKINYKIDLTGSVAWDKPAKVETFNFDGRDTPFMLLDHRPVSAVRTAVGSANTLMDGQSYQFGRTMHLSDEYTAPLSSMSEKQRQNVSYTRRSVWDSGDWYVDKPEQNKHSVTYQGFNTGYEIGSTFPRYRSDGYTGSMIYGVNERIFSTESFIVLMPNEYRIGGSNNPDGKANNANYRATVTMLSYTDEFGNEIPFDNQRKVRQEFTERNNPNGAMSMQTTFHSEPGGNQLGTPNISWSAKSKGDASTLIGEDVRMLSTFKANMTLYGGYKSISRWNTDAFELTPAYAEIAERRIYSYGYWNRSLSLIRNNYDTQNVLYGVATFDNHAFDTADEWFDDFTKRGMDDYDWYDTYEEAIKHGPVGAIQNDIHDDIGPKWRTWGKTPLRVRHENIGIGAETYDKTANIGVTNTYAYLDEERTQMVDASKNRAYHNPAIWDENGVMLKKQLPSGSTINFETLAVTPAEAATTLETDKSSYYNSETVKWTARNSVKLPESGVPDNLDAGVTVKHTLPEGLDYKTGSGKVENNKTDPEVTQNANGTKTLTWRLLVSNQNHSVPTITFETTINPFALDANGAQSSVQVKAVIESDLDQRGAHLRTTTQSITVLKVGMVGIYETINKTHGDKNSDFTITLSPYTTIEDEEGVTGLTHLPLSGDDLGSEYEGYAEMKDIELTVDRVHDDAGVTIHLNKDPVYSDRPHEVDVTKDGWYPYTGNPDDLNGAVSLLFHVDGRMTNKDTIEIDVTIHTEGNEFGNKYLNETVINSNTDYRLSPVSNRVRYTIRADLELALERFQIYTNKADKGLPTNIRVAQTVLEPDEVKDENITLAIYDTVSGDKVTEKTYKQHALERENTIQIPPDVLEKADKGNYEVRIEGYDTNKIWVRNGEGKIDTDGYTAKEKTLTTEDADESGDVTFKGVVMTERELGKEMVVFHESWNIKKIKEPTVKSGYGYAFNPKLTYSNDLLNDVKNRIEDVSFAPGMSAFVDHRLMDTTLEYYDADVGYEGDDKVEIDLLLTETSSTNKLDSSYQFPQLYLEQGTGHTYSGNQKENGEIEGDVLDAGNKLYVPVWIDEHGTYDVVIENQKAFGSHFMNVRLLRHVNVSAYMFNHTDSGTPEKDELLIHPMLQDDIPEDWGITE